MLETMIALTILGMVLLPLSMQMPSMMNTMKDVYIKNRLVFVAQAMGEYFSRWANKKETDLDTYWVENWEDSVEWHDFEARNLNDLIGVNVNLPRRFRVNIVSFGSGYDDKIGFSVIVYYDSDASKSLTSNDINRVTFYVMLAQRGPV